MEGDYMLFLLVVTLLTYRLTESFRQLLYKRKISELINCVHSKEDLLYLNFRDYMSVIIEVLKRSGYKVRRTNACGVEGGGLELNNLQFAEIWKHGLGQMVDVEMAMNLSKCMRDNSIYRGMLITLGDFKTCTKNYCHKNVIECINGDRLLNMLKVVQNKKAVLEPVK